MFSERCKALEDFLLELKRSVDFTRTMMVMVLTQDDKDIHSKSEDSGICYPAKQFELSANFLKNATKWPKVAQI